jgi:uncharacterized coiled-coil protein SlyX
MAAGWSSLASAAEEDHKSAIDTLLERIEQLEQTVAQQQSVIQKLQDLLEQLNADAELAEGDIAEEDRKSAIETLLERIEQLEQTVAQQQFVIQELREMLTQLEAEKVKAGQKPAGAVTIVSDRTGKNYMQLSLVGLLAAGSSTDPNVPNLELGAHDPSRRGFTIQNAELVLNGAVDPYFTAQANIVFIELPEGETEIELEELFATTSSLPHSLQAKAGLFFTEFGRLNLQHPHFWDFVDQPLSHARMFGPDNLRSSGARLSWLMPLPFYSELLLTVQNAFGETLTSFGYVEGEEVFGRTLVELAVRSLEDLLYVPRYTASVDPTSNQALVMGVSAALGPNGTGDGGRTAIYGADVYWKWKSPRANQGFPFLKVQAEGTKRRYRAVDPLQTFEDWGAYGQVLWGYKRGWVAGIRYDSMGGDDGGQTFDPFFEERRRTSVNLSWFPTEYSKLRLQYNHDDRSSFEDADSLWLQFEFILGAHAAHKF